MIKLENILEYLFPKACFRLKLQVHRLYEGLGIELVCVKDKLVNSEVLNNFDCPKISSYTVIAEKKGSKFNVNKVKDYSELYTRKQMRVKF